MNLLVNIVEAFRAIRENFLRTVMTILIVALGLTALVGVLTSIDGIKFWFTNSFVRLGANTFRIENYTSEIKNTRRAHQGQFHSPITYQEAWEFRDQFESEAPVSVVGNGSFTAQVRYQQYATESNIQLIGADENFILTDNYAIELGRNINPVDIDMYRNVILLGHEAVKLLFPGMSPLGRTVYVDGKAYRVVGTFQEIGAQGLVGGDKVCVIPVSTLQKDFPDAKRTFGLHVTAPSVEEMDQLVFEATGVMRRVRRLKPKEEDDFGIVKVEAILDNFMESLQYLTWSATIIALITLLSAAIGLMNIMLVSVTERTREIGIRKATGATRGNILSQFLTEAVVITQMGGILGMGLGILIGNLIGLLLGSEFVVPWRWVLGGFALCLAVGIAAGIYPARRAARLDPIESLRYE